MYNERRETFTIRNVILTILFIALFVFLLIWIFPTKQFFKNLNLGNCSGSSTCNSAKIDIEPLLDQIFNTNVMTMKDAAKSYYTTPRLPQKVGDKVKLTLGEMLEKKLLLDFTDKYGKTCDKKASYVEITKAEDEYVMKVNLKCSKQEDYILVYMGCYNYCSTAICENKEKPISTGKGKTVPTPTPTPTSTPKPTITPVYNCKYINGQYWGKNGTIVDKVTYETQCITPAPATYSCMIINGQYWGKNRVIVDKATYEKECVTPVTYTCQIVNGQYWGSQGTIVDEATYKAQCTTPQVEYEYQYVKVTGGSCSNWSAWSDWSSTKVSKTDLVDVETKTQTSTKTESVLTGYRQITYYDKNAPIYETKQVFNGYVYNTVCTNWKTEYEYTGTYKYGNWTFAGYEKFKKAPADTDTVRYTYDAGQTVACGDCGASLYAIYKKETRIRAEVVNAKQVCQNWEQQKTATYKTVKVITGYETKTTQEPVYEDRTTTVTTTLYRYRTRTCNAGSTDYKWSYYNDKALIYEGYNMTGKKREKKS